MKLYELTFSDPERGFIRVWKRNKKEIAKLCEQWKSDYPLRNLASTEYVDIPTDKTEFVEWLNARKL
jgi:hypothetical protein